MDQLIAPCGGREAESGSMEHSGAQLLVCFLLTVLIWVHEIPAVSITHVTAQTLSPCYSANLTPTSDRLISAVGCTVVFSPPGLNFSTGIVRWDYKNISSTVLSIIVYYKEQSKVDLHPSYNGNVEFSKTHWTLQIKLQLGDGGMYRFRTNSHETKWFQLEVIEPLSQPELWSNSSLVGSTIEFICKVPVGKVESYQWKKDGKHLPEDSRFLLFQNDSILCILNTALSDNGVYTCEVSNQVSWNETSLKLDIQNPLNVVVGVVVVVVVVVVLVAALYFSKKPLKCPTQCLCGDSNLRRCLSGGRSSGPGEHVDCKEQMSPSSGTPESTVALLDRNPLDSERDPNQASAAF